jgi:adenylate cyclase
VGEEVTHQRLMHIHRTIVLAALEHHGGSIVKHTGDGFLATFESVVLATCCALEIQEKVAAANADGSPADAILFRMGLNLADVIIESHDVFGDGVNVAARLQTYAEPGGLIVSGIVAEAILGQVPANITSIGDFYPKNLSRPIQAFSVHVHGAPTVSPVNGQQNWERPSIAVLPFQYVGDDPEYAYFAEGLIEGIIHPLSGLDGLLVISQSSTHAYAGKRPDVRHVGRELGVRYVLSGTLYRFGAKIRILSELTEAETGAIISVDRQEGNLSDLFELQDRISAYAVGTIAPHVREWELQRLRRKPANSLTAYELMLRAGDLMLRLNASDFNTSRGLLQQAIVEDPGYAPAWTHAAYWHILRIGQGWTPDITADHTEALRCATAALERDEGYALALAIRGHIKSFLEHDFAGATVLLERALATGPNVALAWSFASATSGYLGDGPTAVLRAERALRISPRDPYAFRHEHMLSQAHYINSNFEEAIAWGERAAERNRRMTSNLRTLCAALVAAGKLERARAVARDLLAVEPTFRLTSWSRRTPLRGAILEGFAARLREAGLQD